MSHTMRTHAPAAPAGGLVPHWQGAGWGVALALRESTVPLAGALRPFGRARMAAEIGQERLLALVDEAQAAAGPAWPEVAATWCIQVLGGGGAACGLFLDVEGPAVGILGEALADTAAARRQARIWQARAAGLWRAGAPVEARAA